MLYTYTNQIQELAVNDNVVFNTTGIQTGCTVTHNAGEAVINLNRHGFYMIHFNADFNAPSAGVVNFQLYKNGIAVNGAEASSYIQGAGYVENASFSVIVRVKGTTCACDTSNMNTSIVVRNIGVSSIVTNAAITITKIA